MVNPTRTLSGLHKAPSHLFPFSLLSTPPCEGIFYVVKFQGFSHSNNRNARYLSQIGETNNVNKVKTQY